ncbi:hypothetical protein [Mycobacteroides abscessus]|uniref:hypothetical protein n=1 Tax=Mycobacteroides abscessus TaxID=36809 RepID=UPI0013F65169|nr:hypothetical protein [Mycobacteroides abscessus]
MRPQLTSAQRIGLHDELTQLRRAMDLAHAQRDNETVDRLDDRIFELECLLGLAD